MSYRSNADLGGSQEHGAIIQEPEGELFHAPWEPRVLALTLAMTATGLWNLDMNRAARETLVNYRELSYYEIWLAALEKLLAASGVLQESATPPPRVLRAELVAAMLARGTPFERAPARAARFALGHRVRMRAEQPVHHSRLPGYARGKIGVVTRVHGVHVFADTNASGQGECPQWLYTIAFDEHELWGADSAQRSTISVDAWEPYLEPA